MVNVAADHGDNEKTRKSLFIAREKEINEILNDLKSNKGTRLLLVGESGSGKSDLVDEIYRRITEEENERNRPFIGYYSRKESLIAPSQFLFYPFNTILASLAQLNHYL